MKVLIISNAAFSKKDGLYFTNKFNGLFSEELLGYGHSLSYCGFSVESSNPFNSYEIQKSGAECVVLQYYRNKVIRYIVACYKLFSTIRKHDFVYLYFPSSFLFVPILCKLLGKGYGIYIRGMKGVHSRLSKAIYKYASVVLTVSDYFTDMVNGSFSVAKAYTIRPMIPYKESDIVHNRVYESKLKYSLLYLGRMDAEKGLVELMHATKELIDMGQDNFELNLVGSGPFETNVKRLIVDLSLGNHVHFLGPIMDNVAKLECFKKSDIYILPTHHEGFPRTLYEAMIAGTPIVTTMVGGIPSVMRNGYNCLEILPKSIESIITVLREVLSNYPKVGALAVAATKTMFPILKRSSHAYLLNDYLMNHLLQR